MESLQKTVCITGAAKGIGRAIARIFAQNQANVIINYHSSKDQAEELKRALEAEGCQGRIANYGADVTDVDQVREMFRYIKAEFNGLDVLINNAGVTSDQYLMLMKKEDWHRVLDTNLNSVFYCSKAAVPLFIEKRRGCIINIASTGGVVGIPAQTNYAASKAGVIGFTRVLAKEVAQKGITVNCVSPGFILTEMLDAIPEKKKNGYRELIPVKRFGETVEVAELVFFLASEKARYITGQNYIIDGGLSC